MIYQNYRKRVIYSDAAGEIELGYVKFLNGKPSFISTKIVGVALDPADLYHIGKIVSATKE